MLALLTVILIALKISGLTTISWLAVFLPFILVYSFVFLLTASILVVGLLTRGVDNGAFL